VYSTHDLTEELIVLSSSPQGGAVKLDGGMGNAEELYNIFYLSVLKGTAGVNISLKSQTHLYFPKTWMQM
jgi:hypothetical protein